MNKKRLTKDETNVDIHHKSKLLYKGSWEGRGGKKGWESRAERGDPFLAKG